MIALSPAPQPPQRRGRGIGPAPEAQRRVRVCPLELHKVTAAAHHPPPSLQRGGGKMRRSFMNATMRHGVRLLAVLATAVFLISCGSHEVATESSYDKVVEVNVQAGAIQPISLVGVPASKPGVIKWVFAGSSATGYVFPGSSASAPGIVFKTASAPSGCSNTPDPSKVFHNCDAKLNGTEFHCNVKKGDAGNCFAYTVKLVPAPGSSAPAVAPLDPWIRQE
jgi:hypothetical protein